MIIFLDTSPLGAITNPRPKSMEVRDIQAWARQVERAGHSFIVPAVVDYEQRREHVLRGSTASIAALDAFIAADADRYLPLTDGALKRAATLWADIRRRGLPTADAKALDCDILLAAQVLDLELPEGSFTVVTDNVGHLGRVIDCRLWLDIAA